MKLAEVTKVALLSILWVIREIVIRKIRPHDLTTSRPHESGYSLVEVMASITILAIAIIPMVGMFDTGLKVAGASGDYDKARALANLVLEEAKGLSYEEVRDDFAATPAVPNGDDFEGFGYEVDQRYLKRPPTGSGTEPAPPTQDFAESDEDEGLIKLTVTVRWGEGKTYSATGLIADGL